MPGRAAAAASVVVVALSGLAGCSGEEPDLRGVWRATNYFPPGEVAFVDTTSRRAFVEFRDDGTFVANEGCGEEYTGTYELVDDDIEVDDLTDEEVTCELQVPWDDVFRFTARVEVDGRTATFVDEDGIPLVELVRKE